MTAVYIAYSRTRVIFRGITTGVLLVAGFFMIFFSAPRIPGISGIVGTGIANADAPAPTCQSVLDMGSGLVNCSPTMTDYYVYVDPGCGCGCGCGF